MAAALACVSADWLVVRRCCRSGARCEGAQLSALFVIVLTDLCKQRNSQRSLFRGLRRTQTAISSDDGSGRLRLREEPRRGGGAGERGRGAADAAGSPAPTGHAERVREDRAAGDDDGLSGRSERAAGPRRRSKRPGPLRSDPCTRRGPHRLPGHAEGSGGPRRLRQRP